MSELALRLIQDAKLKKLTTLYLGNCGLSTIPEELFKLTWLENLNLTNGQVHADSRPNNIFSIPDNIEKLQKLKTLSISGGFSKKRRLQDIGSLSSLTKLEHLDLSYNKIYDITSLIKLTNLKHLDLRENKVINIYPLVKLQKIQKLNLNSNKIKDFSFLKNLVQLLELDIGYNYCKNLEWAKNLVNLQILELISNQIQDLSPLSKLKNIKHLSIWGNKVKSIASLQEIIKNDIPIKLDMWMSPYTEGIFILDNPIEQPPIYIIERGKNAILSYFESLKEGKSKINEAKLIIVGEPGAGKTSLMKKLINLEYSVPTEEDSTLGIKIEEGWQFPQPKEESINFSTNIWDFGGQQIQYMTHQFFLTPGAVYVLVSANDRKETTANFPYWFKIIHLLGEENGVHSPILVVQNDKNGQFINQFNETYYRERYPELSITTRPVDLKNDDDFKVLRNEIQKLLISLPHVNEPRPAKWEPIRSDLRELAKTRNHISFAEYATICAKHEVTDYDSQKLLSYYLHRLGSLLHFADDTNLFDFIILNPQWAVDAVYSVLNDNSIAKNYGYFTYAKLESIWKEKYNATERNKLLTLMKKDNFEICYQVECKENIYIAPQLLNEHRPKYDWNGKDSLKFRFQYQFMPEGIITRLIVRLNDKLEKTTDEYGNTCDVVWRKGMVLNHDGCRAQIIEEENNRDGLKTIDIAVTGNLNKRKYLLHLIRTEVENLHKKWFRNITVEQMIPCICAYCTHAPAKDRHYFKFSVLQRAQEKHKKTVECEKEFLDVPVLTLLEGIFEKAEINDMQKGVELMAQNNIYNYTFNDKAQFAQGNGNTQTMDSHNVTISITTDQRQVISAVLDELMGLKLPKEVIKAANKMTAVVEEDIEKPTSKTQTILGRLFSGVKQIAGFTEDATKIGQFVSEHQDEISQLVTTVSNSL